MCFFLKTVKIQVILTKIALHVKRYEYNTMAMANEHNKVNIRRIHQKYITVLENTCVLPAGSRCTTFPATGSKQ